MTDKNDDLIRKFMDTGKADIPDNGFTARVMRNLPDSIVDIARLLNLVSAVLCILLFILFDGFHLLGNALRQALINADLVTVLGQLQWQTWGVIILVCGGISVHRLVNDRLG
ncbi:MAG: DUF5056 domain-containing protein [Phocaeicola sp.]|nr:DUF5056 domain-containing protein [Phocaeicola sp.]